MNSIQEILTVLGAPENALSDYFQQRAKYETMHPKQEISPIILCDIMGTLVTWDHQIIDPTIKFLEVLKNEGRDIYVLSHDVSKSVKDILKTTWLQNCLSASDEYRPSSYVVPHSPLVEMAIDDDVEKVSYVRTAAGVIHPEELNFIKS